MLDPTTSRMARECIEIAIEERWSRLNVEISEIASRMARRGLLRSSMTLNQILELYQSELDIQVSMAWGQLSRVLAVVGVGPLEHLAADLRAFMAEMIEWITSGLSDRFRQNGLLRKGLPGIISPLEHLNMRKAHATRKIYSEIDLFVTELGRAVRLAQNEGATNVNIYGGQVGILQTGASSNASMTVRLDSTSKQEIAKALDTVEKTLGEAVHVPFNRAEISEIIRESKSELDKSEPNVSRLRSLMTGVATSIQTVASLRPAYDAIKGGLALIGVTLP